MALAHGLPFGTAGLNLTHTQSQVKIRAGSALHAQRKANCPSVECKSAACFQWKCRYGSVCGILWEQQQQQQHLLTHMGVFHIRKLIGYRIQLSFKIDSKIVPQAVGKMYGSDLRAKTLMIHETFFSGFMAKVDF